MSERANPNDLIAFAGPVFDLILRLKAGIVAPSNDLRPKIASMLDDFEQRAERYRFSSKIIQVSKFALASFVDETVLTNNFNLKEEWEKNPLQLEYFGEHLAGNKFFEKLAAMIKQVDVTADAVEIYYVCMLLGFKGRYAVYEKEKLLAIMQETANALVRAGKIRPSNFRRTGSRTTSRTAETAKNADLGKDRRARRTRFRVHHLSGDVSGRFIIFAGRDRINFSFNK